MANIFYFGDTPLNQPIVALLHNAGHNLHAFGIYSLSTLHDLRCHAVLVDWKSPLDQAMVRAAKQEAIPVVVVSRCVSEAFWADRVLADIYLEKPVDAVEIVSALLEAIDECQNGTLGPNHGVVSVATDSYLKTTCVLDKAVDLRQISDLVESGIRSERATPVS
jgi:hypothetical protein